MFDNNKIKVDPIVRKIIDNYKGKIGGKNILNKI